MQAKVRYFPPHKREGGTLENVAREIPNAARTIDPRGFLLRLIQLHNLEYMKEACLSMEARGHHVATCISKWKLGTTSTTSSSGSSTSTISSSTTSTSSLASSPSTIIPQLSQQVPQVL